MCDPNKPLSDKHQAFVGIYLQNGRNATKAYKEVYQSDNDDSAGKAGHRLLKNVEKHPYFVAKCAEVEKSCGVSFKYMVHETLDLLAKCKGDKTVQKRYKNHDTQEIEEVETVVFQPMAALDAVDKINKMFGYYKETAMKLELSGQGPNGEIEHSVKQVKLD